MKLGKVRQLTVLPCLCYTVKQLIIFPASFTQLGRATVHNAKTGKLETATYRVSKRYNMIAIATDCRLRLRYALNLRLFEQVFNLLMFVKYRIET